MSINQKTKQNQEICDTLQEAIEKRDVTCLKEIIAGDFDVNRTFEYRHMASGCFGPQGLCDQRTALIMAIWNGWKEGVCLLIESGVDIEKPDYRVRETWFLLKNKY